MFDIGWTELLVVVVVAILVVGPKELPRMLRTAGQFMGKMRRMASEFQSTFNDAVREAERQADLDDIKKSVGELKAVDPLAEVKDAMNPLSAIEGVADPTKSYRPAAAPETAAPETGGPDPVDAAVAEMNPDDGLDDAAPAAGDPKPAAGGADRTTQKAAAGEDTLS